MNADDDWVDLTAESDNDHLPAENSVEVFFPLDNSAAYQYFRLEITAVRSGGKMQLGGFSLVGTPVFGTADFTLPADLTAIEESAFEGLTAMTVVDAGSVTSIGANAFKDCTGLTKIRLSGNCTIDATAFDGCGTVTVFAPAAGDTEASCEGIANCVFVAE